MLRVSEEDEGSTYHCGCPVVGYTSKHGPNTSVYSALHLFAVEHVCVGPEMAHGCEPIWFHVPTELHTQSSTWVYELL